MTNGENLSQLQAALSQIDDLIRAAAIRAQASGQDPTDALRGLIISPDEVNTYLQQDTLAGFWSADNAFSPPQTLDNASDAFHHLVTAFNLDTLDSYILMLCLTPELDRRYERLYAYLQDDVSQRYPTVNLMMNLLGGEVEQRFAVWRRLAEDKPLRKYHLIHARPDSSRANSTFLAYQLKIDHRIVAYLLGEQTPDPTLGGSVQRFYRHSGVNVDDAQIAPVRDALTMSPLVYMHGGEDMGQVETASILCEDCDLPLIVADLAQIVDSNVPFDLAWRLAVREAYLHDGALFINHWEACLNEDRQPPAMFWDELLCYPHPVFISGESDWEPQDRHRERRMLRMTFDIPTYHARLDAWNDAANHTRANIDEAQLGELATKFRFTVAQIDRTMQTAADLAATRDGHIQLDDLYRGAQAHASLNMGHLAKRIVPRHTWDNLILPPDQLDQLREMTDRARFGQIVQDDWGFNKTLSNGQGISALFAGESGTGKTLATEVIAHDLGLVLYKIDLSAVVSKYIGETEKNLNKIFGQARSSNAILFFDEADALFGKRSEVKDARDRYANIEVAYLLQEIEAYDGIAILATNLRQNLDEAFTRRLDFLIDFPFPDEEYRRHIWQAHFPPQAPMSDDVDLAFVAERYRLAGGNIRNAALAAAYLAAADGGVITPMHIRTAVRREHQKMGRLLDDNY